MRTSGKDSGLCGVAEPKKRDWRLFLRRRNCERAGLDAPSSHSHTCTLTPALLRLLSKTTEQTQTNKILVKVWRGVRGFKGDIKTLRKRYVVNEACSSFLSHMLCRLSLNSRGLTQKVFPLLFLLLFTWERTQCNTHTCGHTCAPWYLYCRMNELSNSCGRTILAGQWNEKVSWDMGVLFVFKVRRRRRRRRRILSHLMGSISE